MFSIEALDRLQEWFAKLPGVGPKSAARMAYHIIEMNPEEVKQFAQDLYKSRLSVRYCPLCGNLTENEGPCSVCSDETRDQSTVCVVKDPRDVMALERIREYHGVYHVLGGTIDPLHGIGPDDLRIKPLLDRIRREDSKIREIILATNPDVQGEATAVYLSQLIKPLGVNITRIAHGVPVGGELEYTDEVTLLKSLEGRQSF